MREVLVPATSQCQKGSSAYIVTSSDPDCSGSELSTDASRRYVVTWPAIRDCVQPDQLQRVTALSYTASWWQPYNCSKTWSGQSCDEI